MAMHRWENQWKWTAAAAVVNLIFVVTVVESAMTEINGIAFLDKGVLTLKNSPYLVTNDIVVEGTGTLTIEPGVQLFFMPGVGITVRGVLKAEGNTYKRIVMTRAALEKPGLDYWKAPSDVRLVEGPSISTGRLQLFHNNKWRSVCTNSRNWTSDDLLVACRHLGFQGGVLHKWFERNNDSYQLLYESPRCLGREGSLLNCNKSSIKLGSGVCDNHYDIGIRCEQVPAQQPINHWRGIEFESSKFQLLTDHAVKMNNKRAVSVISDTDVLYAGVNRTGNMTSAINIRGIPPYIKAVNIRWSAFNGINVTKNEGLLEIINSVIEYNRGFGVFINSSSGTSSIHGCTVQNNGGDGVRYVHHDLQSDPYGKSYDLCQAPDLGSEQLYPLRLFVKQFRTVRSSANCAKALTVTGNIWNLKPVLTVHFVYWWSEDGGDVVIEFRDGDQPTSPLILAHSVSNSSRPQSITSTGNKLYVRTIAKPNKKVFLIFDVETGLGKVPDLNVTYSTILKNNGRGIAMDNIRSMLAVSNSHIEQSNHIAGIHVFNGSGDVNVTSSTVVNNIGDGINVSYSGGRRNITNSTISRNERRGIAIWFNETSLYDKDAQQTHIAYSNIVGNLDSGIKIGNFCGASVINVTESHVNDSGKFGLEILSCWKKTADRELTFLYVTNNKFRRNRLSGFVLKPAVNLWADISYNQFQYHSRTALYIHNEDYKELEQLNAQLKIYENYFVDNRGWFSVSIGMCEYSVSQSIIFTRNWLLRNTISEYFAGLTPRGRAASVLAISSSNTVVYRNIFDNHASKYEISSWLENPYKTINASLNWMGSIDVNKIHYRVFDSKYRYNLATVDYLPFLTQQNYPGTSSISDPSVTVSNPSFQNGNQLGGQIYGTETLQRGDYVVVDDLTVRPTAKLTLMPGTRLYFHRSVGMMVQGTLTARSENEKILFAAYEQSNVTYGSSAIRFAPGAKKMEGRLQVKIGTQWGSICNYRWSVIDAALACHQMGYVLNSKDWLLKPSEMTYGSSTEPILLSRVQCHELDVDLATCESEKGDDIFRSCSHENDVGIRCYEQGWAGIHVGIMSSRNEIKNIEVKRAGLFDPTRNLMKPAVLFDFFNSVVSGIFVHHNIEDGVGILYNNLYFNNVFNNITIGENKGFGMSTRSQGLTVERSTFYNNYASGFHYNPTLTFHEERQVVSRIVSGHQFVRTLTSDFDVNFSNRDNGLFFMTDRLPNRIHTVTVSTSTNNILNVIVIGSIHPQSTENMFLFEVESFKYSVKDLIYFPLVTFGNRLTIEYHSGGNPFGSVVIYILPIERQELPRYPRFLMTDSTFDGNAQGLSMIHYNTDRNEWNDRYLRVKNESVELLRCTIRKNMKESFLVRSPYREEEIKPLSNITYVINETSIVENNGGITQISRDLRNSNNHFHWILGHNRYQGNKGGINLAFPFVWQSNDSHSCYVQNNTVTNNSDFHLHVDGFYARIHVLENFFEQNLCKKGLLNFLGMEKEMIIHRNILGKNKCQFLVEFDITSQTDKNSSVPAEFKNNIVRFNYVDQQSVPKDDYQPHDFVIAVKGIQKVNVTNNVLSDNQFQYVFLAGIRTSSLDNSVNVKGNYWGTRRAELIRERIFDFDDWNSFAIADFSPFLVVPNIESGELGYEVRNNTYIDLNNLGGRIYYDLNLRWRPNPYVVKSDITIMPGCTMIIDPGVRLEFFPSVGILVLGALKAFGRPDARISFVPAQITRTYKKVKKSASGVRLCTSYNNIPNCENNREGFVEVYNETTQQWIPLCDKRFTRRNAEIVCGEMGLDKLNVYVKFGTRLDLDPTYLSRIYSWVEPRECSGKEARFLECGLQNGGNIYQMRSCSHTDDFVFVHCGRRNMEQFNYWGGIRFSTPNYEEKIQYPYDKIFDTVQIHDSMLEYVDIIGAGILHNEKSAAILSTFNSPKRLEYLNITRSASHGISAIAPSTGIFMHDNRIVDNLGIGLVILVLNGDSGERNDSTFRPLTAAQLPYNAFGMIEMCESHKVIEIEERVILYFKYYNYPVDCVKIFSSTQKVKPVGFRLLQFSFFKSDDSSFTDTLRLFDGNIYNHSARLIDTLTQNSANTKRFFRAGSTLSVQLRSSGATENHGFIAEIITLPALIMGTGRSTQFNVTYSRFAGNQMGGAMYGAAGEDNPSITFNHNQFTDNGIKMFGNFTSSEAAIFMEMRNTINFNFENNLLLRNQGGLKVNTESSSSVVGMKGVIKRNIFTENYSHKTLCISGCDESIQTATITHNQFTRNYAMYDDNLQFKMIKLDFNNNYIYNNTGTCSLSVYGYEMLRLQLYQQIQKNVFHDNVASALHYKGTIFAGGAGQSFEENILMNPMNDFEIISTNKSANARDNRIDATNNWWGYNYSITIASRIRDGNDDSQLLQVVYEPYYLNNMTLVDGKCPPGWRAIGSTCFLYGGGIMTLEEAKLYCENLGGTLPYFKDSNEKELREFMLRSESRYDFRAWVLSIDYEGDCTSFTKTDILRTACEDRLPFLCEKDPDVLLEIVPDLLTIASFSVFAAVILLVILCCVFWVCKSRQRQKERLERRNSIRASKRSLRSISCGSFPSDMTAGRRMIGDVTKRAKIVEPPFKGSFDSIEKAPSRFDSVSYFNSSIEDNQSYEICEATNHKIEYSDYEDKFETESPSVNRTKQSMDNQPVFQYGYENKAFVCPTFAQEDPAHPWGSSSGTESTVDMKRYLETSLDTNGRDETFTSRSSPSTFSQEMPIRRQLLETEM